MQIQFSEFVYTPDYTEIEDMACMIDNVLVGLAWYGSSLQNMYKMFRIFQQNQI